MCIRDRSSWGPAYYGLAGSESHAEELTESLQAMLDETGGGDAFYSRPDNRGAVIKVSGG